jgi:hypothetical protein
VKSKQGKRETLSTSILRHHSFLFLPFFCVSAPRPTVRFVGQSSPSLVSSLCTASTFVCVLLFVLRPRWERTVGADCGSGLWERTVSDTDNPIAGDATNPRVRTLCETSYPASAASIASILSQAPSFRTLSSCLSHTRPLRAASRPCRLQHPSPNPLSARSETRRPPGQRLCQILCS